MAILIDRDEVLKILFPLGIPPNWNADNWDYCVSARAVYNAVMKCKVIEHEEVQGTPVESVVMPEVGYRAFLREGKKTIEEVLAMDRRWLLSLREIGPKKADIIIEALEQQGYDCTNLKTMEDWRLTKLRRIKETGFAPKEAKK